MKTRCCTILNCIIYESIVKLVILFLIINTAWSHLDDMLFIKRYNDNYILNRAPRIREKTEISNKKLHEIVMEFDAIQDDETKYKYFEHYCIQSSTLSHEKFDAEYFLSLEEEEVISEEIIPDKPFFWMKLWVLALIILFKKHLMIHSVLPS